MKILVVEDNIALQSAVRQALESQQYLCEVADDYPAATERLYIYQYDILIVDINLPGGTGLDLIREVKLQNPATGVMVISARNTLEQKIEGLELGADDYLTKPFDMAELIARVKSLVRRRHFAGSNVVSISGMDIHTDSRSVYAGGERLDLTRSEYDILLFLVSNPGRVLTRESMAEHLLGDHSDVMDSFDFIYSHIKNLRKKIAAAGCDVPFKTVYGIGYKLET
jgi:DNA-binding response OmpR family regulator